MDKVINPRRRRFLISAGLGGAGAAAAVLAGRVVDESKPVTADKQDSGAGYRMTDHVRNYYRTTRI